MMIDIGVNLGDRSFDGDRDAVIHRAAAAGVGKMIVTGTSVGASRHALEIASQHPGLLYSTAGVHPHYAEGCDDSTLDTLRELAAAPEVVAIGETGLDYFRDLSPRPVQDRWFEAQLELAAELRMPAFMHEREASKAFRMIVGKLRDRLPAAVIHCFTAGRGALEAYLDLDLHIGITGWICDERRGQELQQLVRLIPDDRLLIETDAPYLLPRSLRPRPKTRRNEPQWLTEVCRTVAACRDQSPEQVAALSSANATRLFSL